MRLSENHTIKSELARILGEDEEKINVDNPHWIELLKNGVIVDLDIGRWRGKTNLSWRDLGISQDDKQLKSLINLGHKILLPRSFLKRMDSLESKARANLERYSYKTFWGYFIPVTAYQSWKSENEKIKDEYLQTADEFGEDYEATIETHLKMYESNGNMAYRHFKSLYPEELKSFKDKDEFVNTFRTTVKSHIKSKSEFLASIKFDFNIRMIPLPSMLKDDVLLAQQKEAEYYETQIKLEKDRELAQIEIDEARTEADVKEKMFREMNEDLIAQVKKEKSEQIDTFISDIVINLRSMIYETSLDILTSIEKNSSKKNVKWIAPRSVVQLKNVIDQVNSLNFIGDTEIDYTLKVIKSQIDTPKENRDLSSVKRNIKRVFTILRKSLLELGETQIENDRGRRYINNPLDRLEKNARKELGYPERETVTLNRQSRNIEVSDENIEPVVLNRQARN